MKFIELPESVNMMPRFRRLDGETSGAVKNSRRLKSQECVGVTLLCWCDLIVATFV